MHGDPRRGARGGATALGLVLAALALSVSAAPSSAQAARPKWDTRVFATVRSPGYPAFAYVHPDGRVYEGTYDDPRGDSLPSKILEYSPAGAPLRSWTVPGQNLGGPHGVQVATSDARGDLVLLDLSPPRALILDRDTGVFTPYASFADLAPCSPPGTTGPGCSPSLRDQPPEPDYAAWGTDGSMYVTDYQQAVIWRVPPHGGAATIWLADRRLDGDLFGSAGLSLTPGHNSLLFTQGSSLGLGDGNPSTGKLYSVAIQAGGSPGAITQLWESRFGDLPDGFAIARSGDIYIALVGLPNQLVELGPDGSELERFPPLPLTGQNGSSEPFDNPSSARFLGTSLIVPNQSYVQGNPAHWTLLDVETGEHGVAEFIPGSAGPAIEAAKAQASGRDDGQTKMPTTAVELPNTGTTPTAPAAGLAAFAVVAAVRRARRSLNKL
jgi:sugar lactone lactonase YvrE